MMRVALAAASLLLLACAHAAERADEFAYRAPLTFTPGQAIYQVELPLAVPQGAMRTDLGDLRVFNGAGEVVPHALRAVTSEAKEEPPIDVMIFPYRATAGVGAPTGDSDVNIELRASGAAVLISVQGASVATAPDARVAAYYFDVGATETSFTALKLEWEPVAGGFSGRVDLHASNDLRSWRSLARGAALLDVQMGGARLDASRIEFPAARARYLRMTWPEAQSVLALRSARVEPVAAPTERIRRTTEREAQRGEKEGEYLVDLGAPLVAQRVQIELPQQNTVSVIELSARSREADPWHRVERATFYRLLHGGQEWRNPERSISAAPARYWQLKVDARGGGLGGGMPKLRVGWEPRLLVFVARGDGPFMLAFGHAKHGPAEFRVESLIPGLADGKPVSVTPASLGAIESSAGAAKPSGSLAAWADTLSGEEGRRWLLWTVLIAGVAILGIMAWRMARGLGNSSGRE
jgi:hypothetical protein